MNNAIAVVFDAPGMTAHQYDQIIERLDAQGLGAPPGRLYHVAAPTENGWMVVDVWDSEASFGRFGEALMPIIASTGVTPPNPKIYPAHHYIPG